MEPKKQNNTVAGLAAIGVVLATAVGVFAATFNPPASSVASATDTATPADPVPATVPVASPLASTTQTPASAKTLPAFGSVFPAPDVSTTAADSTSAVAIVASSVYTDGTYSATGSYNSPGGEDQVAVTLTLQNDIVTSVTATPKSQDRTSARYQAMFVSGYKKYVVGKDISSVHIAKVSGSSLTGIGFNAAIAKIEAQAKA